MRVLFIFLIMVGVIAAALSVYFLPGYNQEKMFVENMSAGNDLVEAGSVEEGIAKLSHAVNVAGGIQALEKGEQETVSAILYKAALKNPLQSQAVLEYYSGYGLNPDCALRMRMYKETLRIAYVSIYKKDGSPYKLGESLYTAAVWAGGCDVNAENLEIFNQMFELYEKGMGDDFEQAAWMDAACVGKPVAKVKAVPAPTVTAGVSDIADTAKKKLENNKNLKSLQPIIAKVKQILGLEK